jgi:hypothetical protein
MTIIFEKTLPLQETNYFPFYVANALRKSWKVKLLILFYLQYITAVKTFSLLLIEHTCVIQVLLDILATFLTCQLDFLTKPE